MANRKAQTLTKTHSRKSKGSAFWQSHIQAWSQSGLPQSAYCHQHGISKSAFYNWKSKLKAEGATLDDPPFVAVHVENQSNDTFAEASMLSIRLTNGLSLRVPMTTDPSLLLPWLDALEQPR